VLTHLLDGAITDGGEPMLVYGSRLYFKGSDPVHAENPWVSDGTVAGTHILLNLSNVAPIAGNDSASSKNDAPVTIDILANDSESGGTIDPTSVQIVSQPAHGSVSVTGSGSVVYTPVAGYSGSDSFKYSEADVQGALSNTATVTVSVTAAESSSSPPSGGSGGGGGGGAANLADLLALGGILVMRRTWPNPRACGLRQKRAAARVMRARHG
jgi:ELWxxDGT repeat protein